MKKFIITYTAVCVMVFSSLAGLYVVLEKEAAKDINNDINIMETNI